MQLPQAEASGLHTGARKRWGAFQGKELLVGPHAPMRMLGDTQNPTGTTQTLSCSRGALSRHFLSCFITNSNKDSWMSHFLMFNTECTWQMTFQSIIRDLCGVSLPNPCAGLSALQSWPVTHPQAPPPVHYRRRGCPEASCAAATLEPQPEEAVRGHLWNHLEFRSSALSPGPFPFNFSSPHKLFTQLQKWTIPPLGVFRS